jgi:RNA polymerase sigma factor (sigma-70 family)
MQSEIITERPCGHACFDVARERVELSAAKARSYLSGILVAVAGKSEPAMAELYRLTNAKLYAVCLRICNDRYLAEDILHDVYERIWHHAGLWKPGVASPVSWLAAIARNRAIDWGRKHRNRERLLDNGWDAPDDQEGPDAELFRSRNIEWCISRLANLEEHYRNALSDAYLSEMTFSEISLRDNVPISTVKSRAQRGLRKLQIELAATQET